MADLYGYTGKILMVDLSSNNITTLDTSDYLPTWVGGRGIGAKIHWDMVGPDVGAAAGSEIELAGKTGLARVGVAACFGCQQPCGYSLKYHDGKSVAMGSIKCGEFICGQAEFQETGEYVGRNHYIRVAQQGLLGLSGQPSYKRVIQNDVDGYYDEPLTCVHEGYVTEEDLGIPYKYGTPEFTDMFNRIIAYRQGVGDELAKGQPRFCNEYLGTPEAIHDFEINSMRKGMHGFGVGFYVHLYRTCGLLCRATSTVNSADQRGMYHYLFPMYEVFADKATEVGTAMANWEWTYTAQGVKFMQDFKTSMDLVDRCFFNLGADSMGAYQRHFQRIHEAITGDPYDRETEQEAVGRLWVLERSILARQGHTAEDDQLCDSVFDEYGRFSENVNQANFHSSLEEYYGLRNIDPASGQVRKSEYHRLGLDDVAEALETTYGVVLPE